MRAGAAERKVGSMLFSKQASSMSEYTAVIWTSHGVAIIGVKIFDQLKHAVSTYTSADKFGPGAFLMAIFRCPTAKFTSTTYAKLFDEYKQAEKGPKKFVYKLNRFQMWEVYRGWRRCCAQGYTCTDNFNFYGSSFYNPIIHAGAHFTFDARLGHLLHCDRRASEIIQQSAEPFILKRAKSVE
jgi:hypothetical protein